MSTEVTSNGSSSSWKSTRLKSSVEVMGSLSESGTEVLRLEDDGGDHAEKARRRQGSRCILPARLPRVRSSRPALSSMTTKVNSTMMAPA